MTVWNAKKKGSIHAGQRILQGNEVFTRLYMGALPLPSYGSMPPCSDDFRNSCQTFLVPLMGTQRR